MENVIITDFVENEHSNLIYEMSLRGRFYPQDVFINVFKYKRICPLMLKVINHIGKSKEEKKGMLHNILNDLTKDAMENVVYGYVAVDENKKLIGFLICNQMTINPTAYELTFIFVEEEYRRKGVGTMLMKQFITHISNYPAIVKVKIERHKKVESFYRNLGFKNADETMSEIKFLKDVLPSKKDNYNYVYLTTEKYKKVCDLFSIINRWV